MSLLTIPWTPSNGTGPANIIDAVQYNAVNTAIATAVNNIYPSQILPITTGQATFGATATGVGYKFLANDATATPLTISGVTSQSVDILDVTLTSGGAIAFAINRIGNATLANGASGGILAFGNGTSAQSGQIGFSSNVFNITTANSGGFSTQFNANGSVYIEPTINATNTPAPVMPTYTAAGVKQSDTAHVVYDKVTAGGASTTVTLAGAAVFAGSNDYFVAVLDTTTNAVITPTVVGASSFSFTSVNARVYQFICIGF